jgi:hypothetical protein
VQKGRNPPARRLFELDPSLPGLYVMPISSILGKLPLVRACDTVTIPHYNDYMRGRQAECFTGGKADSSEKVMEAASISSIYGP